MGTYYTWVATKRDIIAERIRGSTVVISTAGSTGRYEVLRHCCRGNCLWKLSRFTFSDPDKKPKTWIELDLLTNGGTGHKNVDTGWGYEPMDEDMWPYYYSCPLSYLKEADPPAPRTRRNGGNEFSNTTSPTAAAEHPRGGSHEIQDHVGQRSRGPAAGQ